MSTALMILAVAWTLICITIGWLIGGLPLYRVRRKWRVEEREHVAANRRYLEGEAAKRDARTATDERLFLLAQIRQES